MLKLQNSEIYQDTEELLNEKEEHIYKKLQPVQRNREMKNEKSSSTFQSQRDEMMREKINCK